MIAKIAGIKNKIASMPPDEFQLLTDLPYIEQSFDQIIENIYQAVKIAKMEIKNEKEISSFEKQMNKLKSEFEDY
jgi:hypothetical protein